jgi:hypothetical protein
MGYARQQRLRLLVLAATKLELRRCSHVAAAIHSRARPPSSTPSPQQACGAAVCVHSARDVMRACVRCDKGCALWRARPRRCGAACEGACGDVAEACVLCARASLLRWPAQRAVRVSGTATLVSAHCGRARRQRRPRAAHQRMRVTVGCHSAGREDGACSGAAGCRDAAANALRWPFATRRTLAVTMLRADACATAALLPRRRSRGSGLPARRAPTLAWCATATARARAKPDACSLTRAALAHARGQQRSMSAQ